MTEPSKELQQVPEKRPAITPKQATTAGAAVVVIVFALINLQNVKMHWIVATTNTPLIVLVAICSLIGLGVGFLLGRRKRGAGEDS